MAQLASERERSFDDHKPDFRHPAFREALLAIAGDGGFINTTKFGRWLARNKGRVVERMRFEPASSSRGVVRWQLVMVG